MIRVQRQTVCQIVCMVLSSIVSLAPIGPGGIGNQAFAASPRLLTKFGPVEHEVRSEFSHIRIRRKDDVRTLIFVRDNGDEVGETMMDLSKPQELLVPYTQTMFASYLLRPKQQHVLIVGLGGGAMVQFLTRHDPQLRVDAVEIDPVVVEIAAEYFQTKAGGNVRISTADAFQFLQATESKYDVIYMDAFLKPSPETDVTGLPLKLKTAEFLAGLGKQVTDDGMVVFNLNDHPERRDDIASIRRVFPRTYSFCIPDSENLVVIGSMNRLVVRNSALRTRGKELDQRFQASFSFQKLAARITR